MDKWGDVFDFVSLQVADHMPADIGGELRLLIYHFLHFIFPKIPYPRLISLQYRFHRLGFTDRYQKAIGVFKGVLYLNKVLSNTHTLVFAPKDSKTGDGRRETEGRMIVD